MNGRISSFRDLIVWQRSMDLVVEIYRVSAKFPSDERFGLTQHVRKSVISVPSNIAEGHARKTRGDYLHHLSISRGSLAETETQMLAAARLQYVKDDDLLGCWQLVEEVGRLLNRLIQSLET